MRQLRAQGLSIDKNVTVVESWFYTAAETTDYGSVSTDRDSARLAISAARESPGDRVPVFGAFDSSDPVAGDHVFHRNLYSPSRDYWRRLGRPDCCCRIRVLRPLPRIFR